MNIQNLVLDINKKCNQLVTANVGEVDSRLLKISVIDNGVPMDLTGITVYLYAKKADGTKVFNTVKVEDTKQGIVSAEITSQVLAIEGFVKLTLLLTKDKARLASKIFTLKVDETIVDDEALESSNEFKALDLALDKLDEWNGYFEETSGKIEEKYTERLNQVDSQLAHIENFKLNASVHDFLCDDGQNVQGDGIHDDTTGIQKALNYCHENNIPLIFAPGKVYMVSQCYLYEGIRIEGNGARLKMLPNSPKATRLLTMQNNYAYSGDKDSKLIRISNLIFDGNCDNQGPYTSYQKEQQFGLFLEGDPTRPGKVSANIDNCVFENFCGDGMHFYTNTYVNCNNIIARRCFRGCIVVSGGNSIFNLNNYTNISDMGLSLDLEVDILGYNNGGITANICNVITNRNSDFGNIISNSKNIINVSNFISTSDRVNVTLFGDITFSNCRFNRVDAVCCFNLNFINCIFDTVTTGKDLTSLNVLSLDSMNEYPRTAYNTNVSNCVFRFTGEKVEGVLHEAVKGYLTNITVEGCLFEESVDRAVHLHAPAFSYVFDNIMKSKIGTRFYPTNFTVSKTAYFKDNIYGETTVPYEVVSGNIEGQRVCIDETYYYDNHLLVNRLYGYSTFSGLLSNRTLITSSDPTVVDIWGWPGDICISNDRMKKWRCTQLGGGTSNWIEL